MPSFELSTWAERLTEAALSSNLTHIAISLFLAGYTQTEVLSFTNSQNTAGPRRPDGPKNILSQHTPEDPGTQTRKPEDPRTYPTHEDAKSALTLALRILRGEVVQEARWMRLEDAEHIADILYQDGYTWAYNALTQRIREHYREGPD